MPILSAQRSGQGIESACGSQQRHTGLCSQAQTSSEGLALRGADPSAKYSVSYGQDTQSGASLVQVRIVATLPVERNNDNEAGLGLRDGSIDDWARLDDRHPAQHLFRLRIGLSDDAFDLTQQTYVQAFRNLCRFDGRSALSTWLYRIAVNPLLKA